MIRLQKLTVTIEVDLVESDQIIPASVSSSNSRDADLQADLVHEQELLDALRADPISYAEFIKTIVVGRLEGVRINRMVAELAHLDDAYTASVEILEKLVPQLSAAAQVHFQQGIREGWISDGIFEAIQANPMRLTVAYPPA